MELNTVKAEKEPEIKRNLTIKYELSFPAIMYPSYSDTRYIPWHPLFEF